MELKDGDFLTADLHVGHCPWPYSMWFKGSSDPKGDWLKSMARHWDKQATDDSKVVILGDALDIHSPIEEALQWISERPGKKFLVPGNNDAIHPMHGLSDEVLKRQGWFEVLEILSPTLTELTLTDGRQVAACHYPASERQESRRSPYASPERPLLHGHTHKARPASETKDGVVQLNVSWTAWRKLAPAQEVTELAELLMRRQRDAAERF